MSHPGYVTLLSRKERNTDLVRYFCSNLIYFAIEKITNLTLYTSYCLSLPNNWKCVRYTRNRFSYLFVVADDKLVIIENENVGCRSLSYVDKDLRT